MPVYLVGWLVWGSIAFTCHHILALAKQSAKAAYFSTIQNKLRFRRKLGIWCELHPLKWLGDLGQVADLP